MEEVSIIGIDLAKRSFQVHGAKANGSVAYRRKLDGLGADHEKGDLSASHCRLTSQREERSKSREAAGTCGQQDVRNG